jgi:hypothetical protein
MSYSDNEYTPPNKFYGATYQYTFYREKHLQLGAMMRVGMVDKQFLVHVPSFIVDFVFNDYLKVAMTVGSRGKNPSYGLNAYSNLPLKKNEFPNSILVKKKK